MRGLIAHAPTAPSSVVIAPGVTPLQAGESDRGDEVIGRLSKEMPSHFLTILAEQQVSQECHLSHIEDSLQRQSKDSSFYSVEG